MATATAPITDKSARATQLREQSRALNQELNDLRAKLAHASGALAILNDKRQKFVTNAAAGRDPKPGAVAALNVALDEAQIPFDGLTAAVRAKEGQLAQTKSALETLNREIAIEEQQAARSARYQELEKEGRDIAERISVKLRALIEDDLPAFDRVRDSLVAEFINVGGVLNVGAVGPEAQRALSLLGELKGQFFDGPYLAVERRLRRANPSWQERGDLVFEIKNLTPPKR